MRQRAILKNLKLPSIMAPMLSILAFPNSVFVQCQKNDSIMNPIREAIEFTHKRGKKLYITINIFPHNRDIEPITEHIKNLNLLKPDAIILSDPGVFDLAVKHAPNIPLHISTQANIISHQSASFWERLGASRLVLGREITLEEIKEIRSRTNIELECFVHGALCISYSGRCYISSFLTNRSANRGACTNTCRWVYTLMEEKRPDEFFPVFENDRGTYIMSSYDLCMIEYLDLLADSGVSAFKLEGRMKGVNYLAGVVRTYREAVDTLDKKPYTVSPQWLDELNQVSNRGYTTGMFFGSQDARDFNQR